ncbi:MULTISPECIES: hypothetical protein [Microbacterium]|jgi:hypothetical protein|uniref:hypothetical protein n=1 Tax=Microbacterium TaxID=33882 RepID=UPI0010F509AC|nr:MULTISPECIES: hypothetical protein [unclassified Microbacterium]MBN9152379.1 hypothetical protein [Microbacterium sp.]MCK9913888.1 hypothetical protein [Microbacteriaceae bacterium K1510]
MNRAAQPRPTPPDPGVLWRRHRRLVRLGQIIMAVGGVVAIVHWLAHLEAFGPGQPPGWLDFAVGYPTGFLLIMAGAIIAGRKRPNARP